MVKEERLQKIIAAAGLASRRKAELLIQEGRVTVNGQIVTQLGAKADPQHDYIKVDGKLIRQSVKKKIYVLLNKPREVISSVSDPEGRVKVTDLVDVSTKIYPVGRLDYNSEGLLLLTNDGDFSKIVSSAGKHMPKVYRVKVRATPEPADLARLRAGIRLKGVQLAPCKIVPVKESTNSWYEVTLVQGKNRQIRDMFEAIGHPVSKLKRIKIGFLTDHGLAVGQYRLLTPNEVERILRLGAKRGNQPISELRS